eukprot:UN05843
MFIQIEINRDIYMDEIQKVLIDERVKILLPQLTKIITDMFCAFNTPFIKDAQSGAVTGDASSYHF